MICFNSVVKLHKYSNLQNCSFYRIEDDSSVNPSAFCIIEGPETVQDFATLQLQDIRDSIKSRRNKIFLLMEEVLII